MHHIVGLRLSPPSLPNLAMYVYVRVGVVVPVVLVSSLLLLLFVLLLLVLPVVLLLVLLLLGCSWGCSVRKPAGRSQNWVGTAEGTRRQVW